MSIDLNEHTREAVLFTLAELTDSGSITLQHEDGILTINCSRDIPSIDAMLYLNDLREMEERNRPYVNRLYINALDIYRRE